MKTTTNPLKPTGIILLVCSLSFLSIISFVPTTHAEESTLVLNDIWIRDPNIIFHNGTYYMTGTTAGDGFLGYSSTDLTNWKSEGYIYQKNNSNYWAQRLFWAPEYIERNGKFYLFFTGYADNYSRATGVAVSDHPLGPFVDLMKDPLTPKEYDCLDGHLFTDTDGENYFYYVNEWIQHGVVGVGEMWVQKMASNFTYLLGTPVSLWKGTDSPWGNRVIDGPSMLKLGSTYYLFWSSFNGAETGNYSVGYSTSNSPLGPFKIDPEPIVNYDGGHSSWFLNNQTGQRLIVFHEPNAGPERAIIRELSWNNQTSHWEIYPSEPIVYSFWERFDSVYLYVIMGSIIVFLIGIWIVKKKHGKKLIKAENSS
jgi:arabinan endo-1,5-alpha-L-arabinosidase